MISTMFHLGNAVTLKAFISQEMTKQMGGYKDTAKYGKELWGGFNMSKKRYRKFEKNFSKQTTEEVNRIILDHLVPTDMWDPLKYCSADWTITVNLQSWEELKNN